MLQRYLTYYNQRKGQPLHVKLSTPRAVETPKLEENEQPTEQPVPEKSISSAVEQEVMKSVPKIYNSGMLRHGSPPNLHNLAKWHLKRIVLISRHET